MGGKIMSFWREQPMLRAFEVLILGFGLFLISLELFIKFVAWMFG